MFLFEDDIVLLLPEDDVFIQITGKYKRHYLLNAVVEQYAEDLSYDQSTGYADRYTAYHYKGRTVELDPAIRFGEPLVYREGKSCGVSVEELVNARYTEGSSEAAAAVHDLEPEEVEIALRYYDWIETP